MFIHPPYFRVSQPYISSPTSLYKHHSAYIAAAAMYNPAAMQHLSTGTFAEQLRGTSELSSRRAGLVSVSPGVSHDARGLRCNALMTYDRRKSHNASTSAGASPFESRERAHSFASSRSVVPGPRTSHVGTQNFNALQRLASQAIPPSADAVGNNHSAVRCSAGTSEAPTASAQLAQPDGQVHNTKLSR